MSATEKALLLQSEQDCHLLAMEDQVHSEWGQDFQMEWDGWQEQGSEQSGWEHVTDPTNNHALAAAAREQGLDEPTKSPTPITKQPLLCAAESVPDDKRVRFRETVDVKQI